MTYLDYLQAHLRARRIVETRRKALAAIDGELVSENQRLFLHDGLRSAERRVAELGRIIANERLVTPVREATIAERVIARFEQNTRTAA